MHNISSLHGAVNAPWSVNSRAGYLVVQVRRVVEGLPDRLLGVAVAELEETVRALEALAGEPPAGDTNTAACGCEVAS